MKQALLLAILALLPDVLHAENIPLRYVSPDGSLTAIVVPVGRHLGEKQIPAELEYECRVEIYDARKRRVWSEDFGSADHDHGRGIAFASWSPDSKYFVFSTVSSGGHHPWQYFTYAFDRSRRVLRCLDDLVGPVVQEKLRFASPDIITLAVLDPGARNAVAPNPTKRVSRALHTLWKR